MNPTPYRAGRVAIGLLYRRPRSSQYASSWFEGHIPMKRKTRTRLASGLLWISVGLAVFALVAAVLLVVHPAILQG